MRHLLSIEDLDRDGDRARSSTQAERFAEVADRHDQEGALAARAHRHQPLLRGLDAHAQLLRARRQAPLGRRGQLRASGSSVEKGESLQGHRRDALAPTARRDRDPHAPGGRRRSCVAGWTPAASSTPATASTSTRRRRCSTATRCAAASASSTARTIWIVGDVLHSRVARSSIQASRGSAREVTVAGPPTLVPRGSTALGCEVRHTLDGLARSRRRLRPADAARADARGASSLAARVRRPLPDQLAPPGPAPAADAPGPVNRGRRALGRGRSTRRSR